MKRALTTETVASPDTRTMGQNSSPLYVAVVRRWKRFVICPAILVISIFVVFLLNVGEADAFAQNSASDGSTKINAPSHIQVDRSTFSGCWLNGTLFTFKKNPDYKLKTDYLDDARGNPFDGNGKKGTGGHRGFSEVVFHQMERVPCLKTAMALKERMMTWVTGKLENPDKKLFSPIFHSEKGGRGMRHDESPEVQNGIERKSESPDGNESSHERYFVGYRLNSKSSQKEKIWFLGLGWKSGRGGGKAGRRPETKGTKSVANQNSIDDTRQNSTKKEYTGPILGLVGQF